MAFVVMDLGEDQACCEVELYAATLRAPTDAAGDVSPLTSGIFDKMPSVNAVAISPPRTDAPVATEALRRDGFVMLPGFFSPDLAARARTELEALFLADLKEREEKAVADPHFDGSAGHSILTSPSHLLLDVCGKCPSLDGMLESLLTDGATRGLLTALSGPHVKMRGVNVRWMTGAPDPPPAHDWHRDTAGAVNLGILLTDVPPGANAATGFIRGSQWYPYNPIFNTLLAERYEGLPLFRRLNMFNRILARKMARNFAEASGRAGDVYLFSNELWHGRQPNLHGRRSMVVLIAFYPRHMPFPVDVPAPPPEVIAQLPAAIRAVLEPHGPSNATAPSFTREFLSKPAEPRPFDLFHFVRLERRVAEACTRMWRRLGRRSAS